MFRGRATQLTNGKYDKNPTCSPDGKFFVYTTLSNGKLLLMSMDLEGGEAQQLSEDCVNFAAISPDGQQIAMMTVKGTEFISGR